MTVDIKGRTALVTGASAGIGRELAKLFARDVSTLVLVARRRDRLEELGAELTRDNPGLRVIPRDVDLTDRAATGAMLDALESEGVAIDVLVNNAGFGDYGLFERSGWTKTEAMLELNVVSATFLLHRVIPGMVGRGFGAIMNIGSTAGMFPSPGVGVYGATKAYFNHLSEVLSAELAGTGVHVTVVCPGPVPTEFQAVAGNEGRPLMPEMFHIDAAQCAKESLDAMLKGEVRVVPGGAMRAVVGPLAVLPKAVMRPVLRRMAKKVRAGG